jgi:hypothetical protein
VSGQPKAKSQSQPKTEAGSETWPLFLMFKKKQKTNKEEKQNGEFNY